MVGGELANDFRPGGQAHIAATSPLQHQKPISPTTALSVLIRYVDVHLLPCQKPARLENPVSRHLPCELGWLWGTTEPPPSLRQATRHPSWLTELSRLADQNGRSPCRRTPRRGGPQGRRGRQQLRVRGRRGALHPRRRQRHGAQPQREEGQKSHCQAWLEACPRHHPCYPPQTQERTSIAV